MRFAAVAGQLSNSTVWAVFLLAGLMLAPVCASANEVNGSRKILDFNETLVLALKMSPELKAKKARASVALLETSNAWSARLPELNVKATGGASGERESVIETLVVGVQLGGNIYDNGASWTRYRAAETGQKIADLNYLRARDSLILNVTKAFLNFSLRKKLEAVQRQQFEMISKQFQRVIGQYREGMRTQRDYLRLKSESQRSEIELYSAKNSADTAKVELVRLISEDNKEPVTLDFKPIDMPAQGMSAKDLGKIPKDAAQAENSYEYRLAKLRSEIIYYEAQLAIRTYYPELNVSVDAVQNFFEKPTSTTESDVATNRLRWSFQTTLSYNVWDWGVRRRNLSIAELNKTISRQDAVAELVQIRSEIEKLILQLTDLIQRYKMARELLQMEESSYNELAADYRNGKIGYSDMILGLRDMLSAKVQMFTMYYSLQEHLMKIRYWEGSINGVRF